MNKKRKHKTLWWVFGLIVGCITINLIGSGIATATGTWLYLDSIGTVISSVLGGYVPGILVGFITNMIKTLFIDPTSVYYGLINILIAVVAAFFAQRNFFKNPLRLLVPIFTTGVLVGGISSVLTWFLYGFATEGISADLANTIFNNTFMPQFGSQISADIIIDLADKALSFLIAFLIIKLIPKSLTDKFILTNWQQIPLSKDMIKRAGKTSVRNLSLRTKILIVLVPSMFIIAIASTIISYQIYVDMTIEDRKEMAKGVTTLETSLIDPDKVDEYIED